MPVKKFWRPSVATSGAVTFSPDVGEIVEEAYERAGLQMVSGYDLRTARRSLDFLLMEWANRGINLWCVEERVENIVADQSEYTAINASPLVAVSILEAVLRTDSGNVTKQSDYDLARISRDTYMSIPSKLTTGRPTQIYVDRQQGSIKLNLWPVPTDATQKLVYTYIRRMQDGGPGGTYDPDVPSRFWPALVAGLAYNVAMKKPEAANRVQMLKQVYDEQFQYAADEDREKAPLRLYPGGYS